MDLADCYQQIYFRALRKAGIPIDSSQQTPDQQKQDAFIFLAVSMEAGSLVSITQEGLKSL